MHAAYPDEVDFRQDRSDNNDGDQVEIECGVRGVYPKPKIAVTWEDR
jgi:hypothetical protein